MTCYVLVLCDHLNEVREHFLEHLSRTELACGYVSHLQLMTCGVDNE